MQTVIPRPQRRLMSPLERANLIAWYDFSQPAGTSSDVIRIDGSNRISLVSDLSGNSSTLVWANNDATVASQSVSAPTRSVTGSFSATLDIRPETSRPSADRLLVNKLSGNSGFSILLLTTGVVRLRIGNGTAVTNLDSTAAITSAVQTRVTIGVTWTDGVGAAFTENGVALGSSVSSAATLANAAVSITVGQFMGVIFRAQVASYDFNPALATGKLVSTVTSGGDVWTVASANDLGARICGERDLVQLTASRQPLYDAANRLGSFDGTNDYLGAAGMGLTANALTYYVTATRGSFTDTTNTFGRLLSFAPATGQDFSSVNGILLSLNRTGGVIDWYRNSASIANTTIPATGTRFIASATLNGATGTLRLQRGNIASGSTSATVITSTKFAVGAEIGTLANDSYLSGTVNEIAVYSVVHDTTTRDELITYAGAKWGVAT